MQIFTVDTENEKNVKKKNHIQHSILCFENLTQQTFQFIKLKLRGSGFYPFGIGSCILNPKFDKKLSIECVQCNWQ